MPIIKHKNKKNEIDIARIALYGCYIHIVAIEYASAMPARSDGRGQGSASMFNYGRGYGEILGWLKTSGREFYQVTPVSWKRYFNIGKEKSEAIQKAQDLSGNNFIPPRCRTPHDGVAEAYLIARRIYEGIRDNDKKIKPWSIHQ